mgnify:CR=1 FL=1
MNKSVCKGCGAPIIWIRTAAGERMPCDPEPVMYWERRGAAVRIVTPNGEAISCDLKGTLDKATGIGYVSHFSTCPQAGRFRTSRQSDQSDWR